MASSLRSVQSDPTFKGLLAMSPQCIQLLWLVGTSGIIGGVLSVIAFIGVPSVLNYARIADFWKKGDYITPAAMIASLCITTPE